LTKSALRFQHYGDATQTLRGAEFHRVVTKRLACSAVSVPVVSAPIACWKRRIAARVCGPQNCRPPGLGNTPDAAAHLGPPGGWLGTCRLAPASGSVASPLALVPLMLVGAGGPMWVLPLMVAVSMTQALVMQLDRQLAGARAAAPMT
jgi:hypothetical protein